MSEWKTEHGDYDVALAGEILRTVVGSEVHGLAIEGTDDHDEMGVYIDTTRRALGFLPEREDFIGRTQPEGARSGPGDTDLVMYSLAKYLRLAVKGNPTVLLPLFAPEDKIVACRELGRELRDLAPAFLSVQAVERFLGYMHAQHERMMGLGKQNRVPSRPELVERYGYDTKYASHALRLAYQGFELATMGSLTLPMPEPWRITVLNVKQGEYERGWVSEQITKFERSIRQILDEGRCRLPEHPAVEQLTGWAVQAQMVHWGYVG